ncbi:MAG: HD domain-containing protein [Deltaproteobacteria bacterium]|nr:HD domain-containing protein [Deltaproteobacteria bacterium]
MDRNDLLLRRDRLNDEEKGRLSPSACLSGQAVRRRPDANIEAGHRQSFQVDADRILHSLAYTRYIDKTQAFYLIASDHITHRVLHVQLVSKISRTIGRLLGLNEDLIEAIALGHDLGHPPFGHDGETYLSRIGAAHGLGPFFHAIQSVRALDVLERKGQGLNLSLQVLDGILCHDGEVDQMALAPERKKDFARLEAEMRAKEAGPNVSLRPMTLEGCVVRLADTISYIGRDVEDAIRLGLIQRVDLPDEVAKALGRTNGTIVFRLVEDLVANSLDQDHLGFSEPAAKALKKLKDFNRERIYLNPRIKVHAAKIRNLYQLLFEIYLAQLAAGDEEAPIRREFLAGMAAGYQAVSPALIVRDFIAGMTDDYFLRQARSQLMPEIIM